MSVQTSSIAEQARRAVATIFLAGGTAGAIDLFYATAKTVAAGGSALRPWQGVAAALFGLKAVINGGPPMAIIGVGLHLTITIGAAAVYYAAARRLDWLVRHALASGVVCGILFFLTMNYVILPLTVIGKPLYVGTETIAYALVGHTIMIGLPISLIVAWRLKKMTSGLALQVST